MQTCKIPREKIPVLSCQFKTKQDLKTIRNSAKLSLKCWTHEGYKKKTKMTKEKHLCLKAETQIIE